MATSQFYFTPITVPGFGTFSTISAHPLQGRDPRFTQPILRGGPDDCPNRPRQGARPFRARAQLLAAEQTVLLSAATSYMGRRAAISAIVDLAAAQCRTSQKRQARGRRAPQF